MYPAQIKQRIDLSDQMIRRHHLVEIKRVKELSLSPFFPSHHGLLPRIIVIRRNHGTLFVSTRFCNRIALTADSKADIDSDRSWANFGLSKRIHFDGKYVPVEEHKHLKPCGLRPRRRSDPQTEMDV